MGVKPEVDNANWNSTFLLLKKCQKASYMTFKPSRYHKYSVK